MKDWEDEVLSEPGAPERVAEFEAELRTMSGKVLTEEDIQQLADEAERGYDVSHLVKPKGKGKTRRLK